MKVLYSWLQELIPGLTASPAIIEQRLTESGIEIDGVEILENGDAVMDWDLTPNRSDCLSMWGAAYEVAAVLGLKVNIPSFESLPIRLDTNKISLVDPTLCPYYLALKLHHVQIGSSPSWMQQRLEALGMRSINNVVDITNYVMMELGQPLHAFDYDCLENHQIVVRPAKKGETILSLDAQKRELTEGTILICDPQKAIGIGGIMGGLNSEVTANTKTILFEAAFFERRSIRRSAKSLDLRSEAAIRFEKGIDPNGLQLALLRVAQLASQLGVGQPDIEIISGSHYEPQQPTTIILRRAYLDARIGLSFSSQQVEKALLDLNFKVVEIETGWQVEVPSRRQDIIEEVDLVEEVARLIGFHNIPAILPHGVTTQGKLTERQQHINHVYDLLTHHGLHEIVNYSFIANRDLEALYSEEHMLRRAIPILNPMNDAQNVMRTSLLPGILNTVRYNQNRQNINVGIYELGRVYLPNQLPLIDLPQEETRLSIALSGEYRSTHWMQPKIEVNFFHLKGILEDLMASMKWPLQIRENHNNPIYHPYQGADILLRGKVIGSFGRLHPDLEKKWELQRHLFLADLSVDLLLQYVNSEPRYRSLSRYQAIYRDLALLVKEQVAAKDVENAIRQQGGELLEQVELFDVYTGAQVREGFKSLAFALTYRAADHTLTDQEVVARHQQILSAVTKQFDSELRI